MQYLPKKWRKKISKNSQIWSFFCTVVDAPQCTKPKPACKRKADGELSNLSEEETADNINFDDNDREEAPICTGGAVPMQNNDVVPDNEGVSSSEGERDGEGKPCTLCLSY